MKWKILFLLCLVSMATFFFYASQNFCSGIDKHMLQLSFKVFVQYGLAIISLVGLVACGIKIQQDMELTDKELESDS